MDNNALHFTARTAPKVKANDRHETTERRETMADLKIRVFKGGAADPATTVTIPGAY